MEQGWEVGGLACPPSLSVHPLPPQPTDETLHLYNNIAE